MRIKLDYGRTARLAIRPAVPLPDPESAIALG